jgi:hypothetical protein
VPAYVNPKKCKKGHQFNVNNYCRGLTKGFYHCEPVFKDTDNMVFHVDVLFNMALPLFVTMTVSCTLCNIMNHYLTKKALGMQTLYDRVLKDLLKVFTLYNVVLTTSSIVGHLFWPVPNILINVLFVCDHVTQYILATTFLVTVCIRFMLVYHTSIIDCVDENRLIRYLRLGVLIAVMLMLIFDQKSTSSSILYNVMKYGTPEKKSSDSTKPIKYLLIIDLVAAVYLHFRLEYDAILVYQENRWFNICSTGSEPVGNDQDGNGGGYSLNTIRMFVLLCIIVIVSPMVLLKSFGEINLFYIFIHFVMFVVIPLLAIVNNSKLKKHAKNIFVTYFTQVQLPYSTL